MEHVKVTKRIKDKSQRATREAVLDEKTLTVIKKLENRQMLSDFHGCISTGKEANVYKAIASKDLFCKLIKKKDLEILEENMDKLTIENKMVPCAIKIYQTSIMLFKDRLKYIQSEKRFETFCSTNPRKLVKLWAEKEVRNLKRLQKNGIPSPEPIYLKRNVLIMNLIPKSTKEPDVPAPRLKDYKNGDFQDLYYQTISLIKDMYVLCNLIHSDLSEYNLLVSDDKIIVIDVGQSVEKTHDNAYEFLIKDILNINNFFLKKNCQIVETKQLFEEITGLNIPSCLKDFDLTGGVTIPDRICDVVDENDYSDFLLKEKIKYKSEKNKDESEISMNDSSNSDGIVVDCGYAEDMSIETVINSDELKSIRKNNKRIVKENQREKRKNKIPKKEKKKREKLNKKR